MFYNSSKEVKMSEEIVDYKTISGCVTNDSCNKCDSCSKSTQETTRALGDKVRDLIGQGWKPIGGVCVLAAWGCQAMVKTK